MRRAPLAVAVLISVLAPTAAGAQAYAGRSDGSWTRYRDPQLGLSLDLPVHLFGEAPSREKPDALIFATADDRGRMQVFSFDNRAGDTPAEHLRKIANPGPAKFTYVRSTRRFFVASGTFEGKIFYRRCNFPRRAGARVACIEMRYPVAEKRAWDRVVTRVSKSLRVGAS